MLALCVASFDCLVEFGLCCSVVCEVVGWVWVGLAVVGFYLLVVICAC